MVKKEKDFEEDTLEEESEGKNPTFNFGIDALKDVCSIKHQIAVVSCSILPEEEKQSQKISLLKSLLTSAIPLAPKLFKDKFKNEILALIPLKKVVHFDRGFGLATGRREITYVSAELDTKINKFIIEILLNLEKKGYFMPNKDESSLF